MFLNYKNIETKKHILGNSTHRLFLRGKNLTITLEVSTRNWQELTPPFKAAHTGFPFQSNMLLIYPKSHIFPEMIDEWNRVYYPPPCLFMSCSVSQLEVNPSHPVLE